MRVKDILATLNADSTVAIFEVFHDFECICQPTNKELVPEELLNLKVHSFNTTPDKSGIRMNITVENGVFLKNYVKSMDFEQRISITDCSYGDNKKIVIKGYKWDVPKMFEDYMVARVTPTRDAEYDCVLEIEIVE